MYTSCVFVGCVCLSVQQMGEEGDAHSLQKYKGVWKIIENKQKLVKHILKTYFLSMLLVSSVTC